MLDIACNKKKSKVVNFLINKLGFSPSSIDESLAQTLKELRISGGNDKNPKLALGGGSDQSVWSCLLKSKNSKTLKYFHF